MRLLILFMHWAKQELPERWDLLHVITFKCVIILIINWSSHLSIANVLPVMNNQQSTSCRVEHPRRLLTQFNLKLDSQSGLFQCAMTPNVTTTLHEIETIAELKFQHYSQTLQPESCDTNMTNASLTSWLQNAAIWFFNHHNQEPSVWGLIDCQNNEFKFWLINRTYTFG